MANAKQRSLYESDFYAWTQDQADRLRALAGDNRFDAEHVAEEIEDLGKAQKNAFHSHLMRALQHLVQVAASQSDDPKQHWLGEVVDHLAEAQTRAEISPNLLREIDLEDTWRRAVRTANKKLAIYSDPTFPTNVTCPFCVDDLLSDYFAVEDAVRSLEAAMGEAPKPF